MKIEDAINHLGFRVEDKITQFRGVITSVAFDLYGCTQGLITPARVNNEKEANPMWFDLNRLKIITNVRVMPKPDFDGPDHGPEDKPTKF